MLLNPSGFKSSLRIHARLPLFITSVAIVLKLQKQWLLLLITVVKVLLNLTQITTCGLPQIKKHFLVQTSNSCCYSKNSSIFYRFTAHFRGQHSPMFQCACNETSGKKLLPFCSLFNISSLRARSL